MPVALDDHTGTIGRATASPIGRLRLTLAFIALIVVTLALVVAEAQPGRAQDETDPGTASDAAPAAEAPPEDDAGPETGAAPRSPAISRLAITVRGDQSRLGPPEAVGDIDGDGVVDLAVGAYSDDLAGENTGAVYLLLMHADGTVRAQQRVSANADAFGGELLAGSGFGFRIAALGDVDDDGTPDVAVSAYRSGRTGPETGEIWVLFLTPDATVRDAQVITDGYAGFDVDLGDGDQLGVDLAAIGDLDANGVTDLAVGAWRSDADPTDPDADEGALYLITLDREGRTLTTTELSPATGWPAAIGIGDGLGVSVDPVGDLDGNGVADLAVGAPGTDADTGAVHIALMDADAGVASVAVLKPGTGVVPALVPGDRFGATVAGLGDIDDDGFTDLAVGGFGVEEFRGAVWVLGLGADGAATAARRLPSPELAPDDLYGHTIAAVREGSAPATALLVGAPGDDAAGIDAGAVYVVPLAAPPEPDPERGPQGDLDNDGVPNGVEGSVDTDGDGRPDRRDRDSDDDGIGDRGELDPDTGLDTDTDGDGLVDRLDPDDDNDGIPTATEGRRDPDVDQIPNNEDLDSDGDGIDDAVEGTDDTDGDGIADYLDTDADGDGIDDGDEASGDTDGDGAADAVDTDADGDGIDDADEGSGDTDGDGAADAVDTDADGDGIDDAVEGSGDTDGDGAADAVDTDADGDGIDDAVEGSGDTDGDGTPDRLDTDADGDGIDDAVEGSGDTDGDGTPDRLDTDADNDGRTDAEEGLEDVDGDGIPDYRDERTVRAAVGVQVLAPEQLVAGEPNELLLSVANAGPDAASMTEATMRIPDGVSIDVDELPEDCWISNDQVVCRFGELGVDETAVRSITADLDADVDDVEFAASVRAPEGRAESSSGTLGVLNDGIGRAADELGTPRGALIAIVVVALVTGAAILVLTRQREADELT